MTTAAEFRRKGLALMGAGVSIAAFWLLTIGYESFAGPEVPLDPFFAPGQWLHALGALLAVFGYFGIYLKQRESAGRLGVWAFAIAVTGMFFFFADAFIALLVFPELALNAPELTAATGPFFTGRALNIYILFAATNMTGIILLAISMLRAKSFAVLPVWLFLIGGILFNLPPIPGLHLLLVAGGVIWGVAALLIGNDLRQEKG